MKNFEKITAAPETLGAFLAALPVADGPWDVEFRRVFCADCAAENCDAGNCPHSAARNNPLWWLNQRAVSTETKARLDEERLYRTALVVWGADAQTLMAFEEMAELQKELCKCARGEENREAIAEEIADVEIMLGQMKILHHCADAVKDYRESKLRRLEDRIAAEPAFDTFADAWDRLKDLCRFCKETDKRGGKWAVRHWRLDAVALEMAMRKLKRKQTMPAGPEPVKMRKVARGYYGKCVALEMPWGEEIPLISREDAEELAKNILEAAARVWPEGNN